MGNSLFVTEDGSHTLYSEQFAQHYHSTHGAVQESTHIFIGCGLLYYIQQHEIGSSVPRQLRIFEVGFGTGLNALLSLLHLPEPYLVYYEAVELYPVERESFEQLYFGLSDTQAHDYLMQLHDAPWETTAVITPRFSLHKLQCDLLQHKLKAIDIVYFDAFSPDAQPELWTSDVFESLYAALRPGGILTTYCAKGEVRRRLQAAGFTVERLPGPPGKREILRATKL